MSSFFGPATASSRVGSLMKRSAVGTSCFRFGSAWSLHWASVRSIRQTFLYSAGQMTSFTPSARSAPPKATTSVPLDVEPNARSESLLAAVSACAWGFRRSEARRGSLLCSRVHLADRRRDHPQHDGSIQRQPRQSVGLRPSLSDRISSVPRVMVTCHPGSRVLRIGPLKAYVRESVNV